MGRTPRTLPIEVIETEILPRLPALSLVRFTSVCKLWRTIISDPEFVKSHLSCTSQNPNDENLVMLKRSHSKNAYDGQFLSVLSFFNSEETILSDLVPYPTRYDTHLIGSVNGLVCLFFMELHKFVIWNPVTRNVKIIDALIEELMTFYFFGFSWDEAENDYKVVMSFYNRRNYVYSCNSNRWTLLTNLSWFPPNDYCYAPSVIVKGEPYWTSDDIEETYVVPFKFEVGNNEFRCLPKLECVKYCEYDILLVNLKDCISALVYDPFPQVCSVDLYCLDESCGVWRKMYNVGRINDVEKLSHYFTGGQIVFNEENEVVCYDPKINKIEGLGNKKGELVNCFSYTASLVYVQGMRSLHQLAKSGKVTKRVRVKSSVKPRRSGRTIKKNPKYLD